MKEQKYQPISCDFYDELEIIAMRKTEAEVVFRQEDEENQTVISKIKTIQAEKGAEFLFLENSLKIRLDKIVSVNGKPLKNHC